MSSWFMHLQKLPLQLAVLHQLFPELHKEHSLHLLQLLHTIKDFLMVPFLALYRTVSLQFCAFF